MAADFPDEAVASSIQEELPEHLKRMFTCYYTRKCELLAQFDRNGHVTPHGLEAYITSADEAIHHLLVFTHDLMHGRNMRAGRNHSEARSSGLDEPTSWPFLFSDNAASDNDTSSR